MDYPRLCRSLSLAPLIAVALAAAPGAASSSGPSSPQSAAFFASPEGAAPARLRFTDVTATAGLDYEHGFNGPVDMARMASGGVAAGDVDGDGRFDLLLVRGDRGPAKLMRNRGDGTFAPITATGDLDAIGALAMGPALADFTGDGRLDLFVGGVKPAQPLLFRGLGDGRFVDITRRSRVRSGKNTFSAAFGDHDRDGDLDLLLSHWDTDCRGGCDGDHLWDNLGDGKFRTADSSLWLPGFEEDFSFTPNFADIDGDGWLDVLMASDFTSSQVFLNRRGNGFEDVTDREVITDKNGMGAAVGDIDNDGDLDWFVSSNQVDRGPRTGNRMYENLGDGVFADVTEDSGVRLGGWGWGACFADFDNDGWLDLFHVNGWFDERDRSVLFMNRGDGTFRERARSLGVRDFGQGRGVVCFDYDRDGDVDLLIANNGEPPRLYRNDLPFARNWLGVRLRGPAGNTEGIGARVEIRGGGQKQMRELRAGNNYVSHDPAEAHFGLGAAERVSRVLVRWPDGHVQVVRRPALRRVLEIEYDGSAGS